MAALEVDTLSRVDSALQLAPDKEYKAALKYVAKELELTLHSVEPLIEVLVGLDRFKFVLRTDASRRTASHEIHFIGSDTSLVIEPHELKSFDVTVLRARVTLRQEELSARRLSMLDPHAETRRTINKLNTDLEALSRKLEKENGMVERAEAVLAQRRSQRDSTQLRIEATETTRDGLVRLLPES